MNLISIKNLSYEIENKEIFTNINFEVKLGEIIAIIGPNGCGKTSLVKIIMGFIKNYKGEVIHNNKNFFGYVPQYFQFFEYMQINVLDFLKFTDINNMGIQDVIEITNINNLLNKELEKLSAGELRKVLLAKALLSCYDILFLDEPTCWLDILSQKEFYQLIKKINQMNRCAIIIISHDPILLQEYFSQIISLERGHVCYNSHNHRMA